METKITLQAIAEQKKRSIAALEALVSPHYFDSDFRTGPFGSSRPLKLWVPRDGAKKATQKAYSLHGLVLGTFFGFAETGVITDTHLCANTLPYEDLPLEDILKLHAWAQKQFTPPLPRDALGAGPGTPAVSDITRRTALLEGVIADNRNAMLAGAEGAIPGPPQGSLHISITGFPRVSLRICQPQEDDPLISGYYVMRDQLPLSMVELDEDEKRAVRGELARRYPHHAERYQALAVSVAPAVQAVVVPAASASVAPAAQAAAVLAGYPKEAKVSDLYDSDEQFASALNAAIPAFEYPDFSHLTVDQVQSYVSMTHRLAGIAPVTARLKGAKP